MGNVFVNILFAASLKYLWKMLDSLQLMVFLPMLSIVFPANSKFFFEMVLGLINFEFINVDSIMKAIGMKQSSDDDDESYGMKRDGNMIQNMGLFFVLITVVAIMGTALFLLAKLLWKIPFVKKLGVKIYDIVVFNAILRSLTQGFIIFSTSVLLNCANPSGETTG